MTAQEAQQILVKPMFGSTLHVNAKKTLELAAELRNARAWARSLGLYPPFTQPLTAGMDEQRLKEEVKYWRNCGYEEEA